MCACKPDENGGCIYNVVVLRSNSERYHSNNIPFIDATADFVNDARKMDLFYPADGHPNSGGDSVIANAVTTGVVNDLAPFKACSGKNQPAESASNRS